MEPHAKKPKMSFTDGEAAMDDSAEPCRRRYKRRKVAIFLAYCGAGYQGMQKNPGAKTIEGDLEEALFLAGAVPEADRGCPKRYDWARSARTDKGVSAAGQVVSGRFYVDPPGFIDRLNASLPQQIRVFGYKRVVNSFSAKKFCDRRRYVYLLPVFSVDPAAHRDREAVAASLGSEMELAKCDKCSERGGKIVGAVGRFFCGNEAAKSGSNQADMAAGLDDLVENCRTELVKDEGEFVNRVEKEIGGELYRHDKKDCVLKVKFESNGVEIVNKTVDLRQDSENPVGYSQFGYSSPAPQVGEQVSESPWNIEREGVNVESKSCEVDVGKPTSTPFTYSEEEKERFNRILSHFVGTHNFHNFTTRTKAEDPAAIRYIVSFTANSTVNIDGMEFIRCEVVGQSFMLHQIRKMIGLGVAIMRNCAPESLIFTALNKHVRINVPTAPELGLYLDECMFASYNNKWRETHEEVCMELYQDEAEKFKIEYIFFHIASTERKEGVLGLWLHSLNHRNYPDLLRVEANNCLPAALDHHNADENGEE